MCRRKVIGIVSFVLFFLMMPGCASRLPDEAVIPTTHREADVRLDVDRVPRWLPLIEGSDVCYDRIDLARQRDLWNSQRERRAEYLKKHPGSRLRPIPAWDRNTNGHLNLSNGQTLKVEVWERYLKNFMESLPLEKRHDVLEGITRHSHEHDTIDNVIVFEPLRHSTGHYNRSAYIGLTGDPRKDAAAGFLTIRYYGVSSLSIERFAVITDGQTYQSYPIDFETDTSIKVREWAYLRLDDPEVRGLVERITGSNTAVVRFQGRHNYRDLVVPDRMKYDMRTMLKAIDAINQ